MEKLFIEDIEVANKRVLMRVDFNVPLDDSGRVADNTRIRESLKSIQYLASKGARVILMSHLGRPKGKEPGLSLSPVAEELGGLLGKKVTMAPDCVGDEVKKIVGNMKPGDVVLLENLRFHKEEEKNDPAFAKELASLGEVYINDAFGTAHRAHASTEGVTHYIQPCAAGYLLQKEIDYLGRAVENPKRPFVAILGGAKISGKIDVIKNLLPKVDRLLVGGGMAYTFFKAQGLEVGRSLLEEDKIDLAREIIKEAGDKLLLPVDCVISDVFDFAARKVGRTKTVKRDQIPPDWQALDIGAETIKRFSGIIKSAKTIVWNGPMGVFEIPKLARGTNEIAKALAEATASGAVTVIGGGDSAAAIAQAGLSDKVTHVSTGGGASLEYLEGKVLPGIAALTDKR
ncbi:MAG: phosphoglycerate kinase [bacterium]